MRTPPEIRRDLAAAQLQVADAEERLADALEVVQRLEGELRGVEGLRSREQSRSVNRDMTGVHKVAISKGRSGDALAVAARKAGLSVTGLAKRLGVSKALLSMARKGDRSIKRPIADRIERLTGFAATVGNWPLLTD